ncbi:MAG: alpha/beta hydrolase [Desulfovibrio sp.]|jgi:pimeloyl-ACP methyl ester carboxylesterase|nr:alpha/beta hydrolase [Desulfovibrio sp.]
MKASIRKINGKNFFFLEWGKPKSNAFLGIHGLTANCCHMAVVSEHLAEQGRYVLAYDVRGRGDSSQAEAPSSILRHAEDAVEIIETLPVEKLVLAGYSMGGYIAGLAAGRCDKVAGVILFDGGGLCTKEDAEKLIPALARMDMVFPTAEEYIATVKANYALLGLSWNKFIEAAVRHEIESPAKDEFKYKGEKASIKEDLLDIAEYKHEELAKIRCPVLLVHAEGPLGQGPPLYTDESYAITRKYIPNLTIYKTKANHYTMMLEPQPELNAKVDAFIKLCGI